jgi:hypothetical protein
MNPKEIHHVTFSEFLPLDGLCMQHRERNLRIQCELKRSSIGLPEVILFAHFQNKSLNLKQDECRAAENILEKLFDKIKVMHSVQYPESYRYTFKNEFAKI